jgi:urease accessory protein
VGSPATRLPLPGFPSTAPGCGALGVMRSGGRSVVGRAYATSPLRLLTPGNHGRAAWIYTSNHGGGLVDGDHIILTIDVGEGAAAFVSTQASTKIYRSPRGTRAETRARIERDGLLVVVPDPVVCFATSRYRQIQQFDLADRAALVLVDWISSGRHAAGERWAFAEYRSEIVVRLAGKLLLHDALALRAADGDLARRIGRFDILAVAVLVGAALRTVAASLISSMSADAVVRRPDHLATASALGDHGCVLRIAGCSVEQVGRTIRDWLGFLPVMLGDDPWTRKR